MTDQEKTEKTSSINKDGTEFLDEKIASLKQIPTKENLIQTLKEDIVWVTFTKLNGDERIMKCTKNYSHIPEEFQPKTDKDLTSTVNVWDLNAQGWRSFRYDRVSKIEIA